MKNTQDRKWLYGLGLALIVALAAALRFIGLRWGLPDAIHDYSYHPDEFLCVGAAFSAFFVQHTLIPRLYNYPSLYLYLIGLAMGVAFGYHAPATSANIYLAARVVTALMGTAAVAVTYWAGCVLWGRGVGLLAALILCIAPIHVQHSHFATVDVPSSLLVAAALGYAGLVLKRGTWRDYLICGVTCGLAAGTRYTAVFVLFSLIAAHFLRDGLNRKTLFAGKLWAGIGCTIAAFVLSTPGCIFRFNDFWFGLTYESRHVATGHGLVFAGTGNGFLYNLVHNLGYGLGPVTIVFLLALVAAVLRRDKRIWMLLAFVIPYYTLISISHIRFARYVIPMLPAIALMCAWVMVRWYEAAGLRGIVAALASLGVVLAGLALAGSFGVAVWLENALVSAPPQQQAAKWILRNVAKGSSIGMIDPPWFYSPPLSKDFGFGTLDQRKQAATRSPYKIVILSECEEPGCWFRQGRAPHYIVVSDYEIADSMRIKNDAAISRQDRERVRRVQQDMALLRSYYVLVANYRSPAFLSAMRFGLPHDMNYTSPSITIYRLNEAAFDN